MESYALRIHCLVSASSMGKILINIDAQDAQDYFNGLVWVLRDESIRPLEFDHHLFLNNDSPKTAPKFLDDFTRPPDQRVGQLPGQ